MSFSEAVFKKGHRVKNTVTLIFIYFCPKAEVKANEFGAGIVG